MQGQATDSMELSEGKLKRYGSPPSARGRKAVTGSGSESSLAAPPSLAATDQSSSAAAAASNLPPWRCTHPGAADGHPCNRLLMHRGAMVRHFATFHGIGTDDPSVHSQYLKTVPPLQGEDRFRCLHRSRTGDGRCGHVMAALHGLRGHLQGIHKVAAKDAMRYVRVVAADGTEIGTNDADDAVDDDADGDAAGSADEATMAYRCTSVVAKGIQCNRLFPHLHALRMHATLTHAPDGSAAEQYVVVEKPLKPDLFCCLYPPRKTSALASLPLRPDICGQLSATLPELVNHLRDDHCVGKDHQAHYTTAVPWDAAESTGAETNMAGASVTSNAQADGQRQSLHRGSAATGASATVRGGGDRVDEGKDDDAGTLGTDAREAAEESAGENAPDGVGNDSGSPAAAPLFRGYWRCMFEVHAGYCRCGFLSKKQLSAHFRRSHGRDLRAFSTVSVGDFVRAPYPLAPDHYACAKEGCAFAHEHVAGVEKHLVEAHGAKDVRSRALFIRVIEADAATLAAMPAPSRKRKLISGKAASHSASSPPAAATVPAAVANPRSARSSKRQRVGPQPPAPVPELTLVCDDDFLSRHSLHLALPDSLPPLPQLLPLL